MFIFSNIAGASPSNIPKMITFTIIYDNYLLGESIDRQSGIWKNFPTIFRIDLIQLLKVEGGVTSFHTLRTSTPPPASRHATVYI